MAWKPLLLSPVRGISRRFSAFEFFSPSFKYSAPMNGNERVEDTPYMGPFWVLWVL